MPNPSSATQSYSASAPSPPPSRSASRKRRSSSKRRTATGNNGTNDNNNHSYSIQNHQVPCKPSSLQTAVKKIKNGQDSRTSNNNKKARSNSSSNYNILWWPSAVELVPLTQEEAMIRIMFERNGKKERGMLKDKPEFLVRKYQKALQQHAPAMNLPQILSLRRHHIKLLNPSKTMPQLRLGQVADINESARIFERAVAEFLNKSGVTYWTEEDQKEHALQQQRTLVATPDFVFPTPVMLRKPILVRNTTAPAPAAAAKAHDGNPAMSSSLSFSSSSSSSFEEHTIHWLEAKMYYGASSIPHGSKGAVGTVLATAQKYVNNFGPGAILFMMGCGDRLAWDLAQIGVTVLDCKGSVSLRQVHEHQRTWCGNQNGQILP